MEACQFMSVFRFAHLAVQASVLWRLLSSYCGGCYLHIVEVALISKICVQDLCIRLAAATHGKAVRVIERMLKSPLDQVPLQALGSRV